MYSQRCCSSELVNCVRLLPEGQERTDVNSVKEHPLLSRTSPTGVLVNGRSVRDQSSSNAFVDPLEMFYILCRGTLVRFDKLHKCGCMVVGEDDARLFL